MGRLRANALACASGTLVLVFALVWGYGLVGELHANAYRDVFFNYCGVYLVFSIFLSSRVC